MWVNFGDMPECLAAAATTVQAPGGTCVLANISTGSYFAWHPGDSPLLLANYSSSAVLPSPMAVLQGIGPIEHRYVQDQVSFALVNSDREWWELTNTLLESLALAPNSTVVDVGAHIGSFAFGLAKSGHRVIAIEPLLVNLVALHATLCLHPELSELIDILPLAVGSDSQHGPCQVISASRNDLGNGKLVCTDGSKLTNATFKTVVDKHQASLSSGVNAGYMFHHRVMHQALPAPIPGLSPMPTLDALLLDTDEQGAHEQASSFNSKLPPPPAPVSSRRDLSSIALVKIDTTGSECEVLDGGSRLLFHKPRVRLILVNVDAPASDACVKALGEKHGFEVRMLATRAGRGRHALMSDRHQQGHHAGQQRRVT